MKRPRWARLLVAAGAIASALVVLVGVPDQVQAAAGLRIAFIEPPPGTTTAQNVELRRGIDVAVSEVNAAGGISGMTRVILEHVRLGADSRPGGVVAGLADRGVAIIVLPCDAGLQPGLAAAAERRGMFILAPCNTDPRLVNRFKRYWPVGAAGNVQAAQLAQYASTRIPDPVGFVVGTGGSRYATVLTGYFRSAAKLYGIPITGGARFDGTVASARAVATAIEKANPKPRFLFTALPTSKVNMLVPVLRARNIGLEVYGTDGLDVGPLGKVASTTGRAFDRISYTSFGFPRPTSGPFARRFERMFGAKPTSTTAGLGYESIRVLRAAVIRARSTQPGAIDRVLAAGLIVRGIAGSNTIYPGGGARRSQSDVGIVSFTLDRRVPVQAGVPTLVPRS